MIVNTCSLTYKCTCQTASGWIPDPVKHCFFCTEKMNVDFQEQSSFYPSSSHVRTKTNRLRSADERPAAHRSGETSADVGSAGSPSKAAGGHEHSACNAWSVCRPQSFLFTSFSSKMVTGNSKSLSHSWCLCLFWRTLTTLVNEDSEKISADMWQHLHRTGFELREFGGCSRKSCIADH